MWRVGWECSKGPKHLWLDPGSTGEEVAVAGFQAGGSSEGWVVDASVYPRIFFRPEAVGRGWLHGGQAQDWLQNNLAVGRWRLRGGHPDPLCWGNGGLFGGPLAVHLAVLFLLSAAATEALRQAADAQDGQDDQEDDDKDPHGAREELILLAAVVTAALESFRAGEDDATFGCSPVRPASGSITQRGIPPERRAAGLGHEGGLRKLPPREVAGGRCGRPPRRAVGAG